MSNAPTPPVLSSFLPAALFLLLALFWSDARPLLRYTLAAAGIAFAAEGVFRSIRSSRDRRSGGNP